MKPQYFFGYFLVLVQILLKHSVIRILSVKLPHCITKMDIASAFSRFWILNLNNLILDIHDNYNNNMYLWTYAFDLN